MAIREDERQDLIRACQASNIMRGCVVRGEGNDVQIHVNHSGQVVVMLPHLGDLEAWIAECTSRCGNGSLATNTKTMTLTFRS